jgi:nitrite reductase/ring-hydroxylating ferredoxin subunit
MADSAATAWHQRALAEITRWPWLQRLNDQATAVIDPVYDRVRGNPVVELMHGGRWLGHSLHPALSDLPIGFWSATLLLDSAGQDAPVRGSRLGPRLDPSSTLTAAGIAAAAATAATGVADWNVSDAEDRRVGLFHGLLNGAGTLIQSASLAARLSGHRRTGRSLGAVGLGVTVAAAYVGGHLVQGRAVMVNRVATHTGPQRWVKAVAEEELPERTPTGVEVEGRQVLLFRADGEVHALDDVCSHAGALLHRGEVDGCTVVCPLHLSVFDLRDGHIVRGPAHHPQPVLPARVRNGWIEVRGSAPAPRSRRASP